MEDLYSITENENDTKKLTLLQLLEIANTLNFNENELKYIETEFNNQQTDQHVEVIAGINIMIDSQFYEIENDENDAPALVLSDND